MDKRTSDTCRKDYEKMGLAASQARFLCLTARKADCEYKSTVLAQEKLNITNQMSQVANDYSQALNATKLMWCNPGVENDFGLTYSLLMTPSAINDYNPYMVTTPSGAIVLNTAYMEAAKAAGLNKAGGVFADAETMQDQRDKFLAALVTEGIITDVTARDIMVKDYVASRDNDNNITFAEASGETDSVAWIPASNDPLQLMSGLGKEPMIKTGGGVMTLADLITSDSIGGRIIDWAKMFVGNGKMTTVEYEYEEARIDALRNSLNRNIVSDDVISQLKVDYNKKKEEYKNSHPGVDLETDTGYTDLKNYWDNLIKAASMYKNTNSVTPQYIVDPKGVPFEVDGEFVLKEDVLKEIKTHIDNDYNSHITDNAAQQVSFVDYLNIAENSLDYDSNGNKAYSIIINGGINHYADELKNLTLADILTQEVVLMANDSIAAVEPSTSTDKQEIFREQVVKMLDSISAIFGYSAVRDMAGQGLNVDDASAKALQFAYYMVKNTFLRGSDYQENGSRGSNHSMSENSAYQNAVEYNRLASDHAAGRNKDENKYFAVSLSNMVSAFLTYYENALSGAGSQYIVGKSVDTSTFVTGNYGYKYIANDETDEIPMNKKLADFYDQLFNNIVEHGWRYDSSVDDNEYLETVIKNGRYSMCSLNEDGYYYQTRY
ncbi:hypothetical protein IKR55_03325, partial [bacterium]|nr:hypothetical protein [bacterium]